MFNAKYIEVSTNVFVTIVPGGRVYLVLYAALGWGAPLARRVGRGVSQG